MLSDRRTFLTAAAATPLAGAALGQGSARPGTGQNPSYPPADAHSVSLAGDATPSEPSHMIALLAELAQADGLRDRYLDGGAVETLEKTFAELLGKDDCALFATGTLANTVAVRLLCGTNARALCQYDSHLYRDESDAAQRLAAINLVPFAPGVVAPGLDALRSAFDTAESSPYPVDIGAISLESPVRRLAGSMISHAQLDEIAAYARTRGVPMHLDGARLLLVPPTIDVRRYAAPFETVYVSLYKYLGAPFGAVLAGPAERIAEARELRHLHGGTIAQGWIPAALALDHLSGFRETMARAHSAGDALVAALEKQKGIRRREQPWPSNVHMLEMPESTALAAVERGRAAGVRIARWSEGALPVYVNASILRRPVREYVRLFAS